MAPVVHHTFHTTFPAIFSRVKAKTQIKKSMMIFHVLLEMFPIKVNIFKEN